MAPVKRKADKIAAARESARMTMEKDKSASKKKSAKGKGNEEEEEDVPTPRVKRIKTEASSTTKTSKIAEMRARAKEWAESDDPSNGRRKAGSFGSPAKKAKAVPAKKTVHAKVKSPVRAKASKSRAASEDVALGTSPPGSGRQGPYPPVNREESSDDDEEEEIVPPPPRLLDQLSLTVLSNAEAYGRGAPTNDVPPAGLDGGSDGEQDGVDEYDEIADDPNPFVVDDVDGVDMNKTSSKNPWAWVGIGIMVAFVAAVTYFSGVNIEFPKFTKFEFPTFYVGPSCYLDSGTGLGCVDVPPHHVSPCPDDGLCQEGKLVACNKLFYEVNPSGTACQLSTAKQGFQDSLVKVLQDASWNGFECDDTSWPFIDYSELQTAGPEDLIEPTGELAEVMIDDGFGIEWEGGAMKVQLPKRYQKKPVHCQIRDDAKGLFAWLGHASLEIVYNTAYVAFTITGWLVVQTWSLATQSIWHFIGCVALALVVLFNRHRNQSKKNALEILNGTNKALEIVHQNSGQPIQTNIVRDELANELFPRDPTKQREWKNNIWPGIKTEVNKGSGVTETRVMSSGKNRPAWKSSRQTKFED